MPEDVGQSRTEAPTPRRREEARQKGQVALSPELTGGVLLLAGVLGLWWGGRGLAGGLLDGMRLDLSGLGRFELGAAEAQAAFGSLLGRTVALVGWFLGLTLVASLAASTLQAGFQVSTESLHLQRSRLSPARGWERLLSGATAARGLVSLLKVSVIAVLAVAIVRGRAPAIASLSQWHLAGVAMQAWGIVIRLALAIAAALVLIGLADYAFQRWRHEQSLRMSRQELREELRREEGDPQMRARIRKLQREQSQRRMMSDVPRATVVITNPVHLAVALRYERGAMPAPKVVAKGAGAVAQRIVELARRHAVPVLERRPLAQALYKAVAVGQEIPAALYYAVAEVLAFVYRLRQPA